MSEGGGFKKVAAIHSRYTYHYVGCMPITDFQLITRDIS